MRGIKLRARREALNLSVNDLAQEFEVLPTTIYRWEKEEVPLKGLTAIGADTVLKQLEQQTKRERRQS